jgi:diguanylate cyclase (GGDEF)-like protein
VGALLVRWRAGLSQGDAGDDGRGGAWPSRVLVARAAAALFLICGASSFLGLLWPTASGDRPGGAFAAAAAAAGVGLLTWFLPWGKWPRWAGLFLVPVGFVLVALQVALARPDSAVSSVLFVLLFAWIGVAFPQGASLLALPLFAAAYLLPLLSSGRLSGAAAAAAVSVGLACFVVGETLAWLATRLRFEQAALSRFRAAVNDIGAGFASAADPETLWSSLALRLSEVAGLPDCDVYRLAGGGSLVCLASVYESEPRADYLGLRPEQDLWGVDGTAVLAKEPIFIASPADPRLGAAEREDMQAWREQAMLIVPLVARGEVVGLVEISETREGRTITPEQTATVVSACRLIAMALHDADRMHAQEEGERRLAEGERRLASLDESSRAVAGAGSLEEALSVVTRCAGEALGVSECEACEHDAELDSIVMRARWQRTPGGRDGQGEPLPLAEDPTSRTVLESGCALLEHRSDSGLDPATRADLDKRGAKSRLTVPMLSTDGSVGLLTFGDAERERVFSDEDLTVASALAGLAGEAVAGARLLRRLSRLSEADAMSGLASHRELHDSLALEQARAEDHGSNFSAVMLGVDGLKSLNDVFGHAVGDEVLLQVASMLSERTGADDVVGRWTGDTFLVILAETAAARASLFAQELCAALAEAPFVTATGEEVPIRVSFGIAAYPEDATDASGLADAADARLRAAKPAGDDAAPGDERERRPLDTGDAEASGPLAEAGAPRVAAELQDRAAEPPADESAADEPATPTKVTLPDDGAIDQEEMRSRIEETRTRLKVKAFDAMIRGKVALLGRDGDEATGPPAEDSTTGGDLEVMVDRAFSEQEY